MTPAIEVKKALVAGCGCIIREGTLWIVYCERHKALLDEIKEVLHAFNQDIEIRIEQAVYEKDGFS